MRVEIADLAVDIAGVPIVSGAQVSIAPGEVVGVIGPNGSGKSTLLRAIYRALKPRAGAVLLGDDDLWRSLSARQSAQRTAVVAQETTAEFDFSVHEVVEMGRSPHKRALEREDGRDREIVAGALERVGMTAMAGRVFATLSGGEKQRALVARALAQESRLLVLDEPTNHLDIKAQLELLALVRDLGTSTIAALHDLNLAAAHCDRLYVLQRGEIVSHGAVADVLTPELLKDVFGVWAHCDEHPVTGRFHLAFLPLDVGEPLADPPGADPADDAVRPTASCRRAGIGEA
jgi:iron complex transport system ATP-binding protein